MNEKEILEIISQDKWMMEVLREVSRLNLPDWYIGAGFVRNKVWDVLHEYKERTPLSDVDVIYFDKNDFEEEEAEKHTTKNEAKYEQILKQAMPDINWSVTNQARMHLFHDDKPYSSSEEALSKWVETATCIGVRLNKDNNLSIVAPYGVNDLVNLVLIPTPTSKSRKYLFMERINSKKWLEKWPKLKIVN